MRPRPRSRKPERRVTVATRQRRRDVVTAAVSDNGEGIAPENLAKIFDPFFTTKPEGKGVGLGLAVSYGIIQAHGGDIEVKSTVGRRHHVHRVAAARAGDAAQEPPRCRPGAARE